MLQLKDIAKQYKTADLVQNALDGVTLNLRDREFVAILGPSGSGKTTLLNVIGGLDHYDGGDLIINGVSTKNYKDRDWDTYRNHSIGFVFQSYNLIPHQTILANVELALTISGVAVSERKKRAADALTKVGLKDHIGKRPNQLSGGQMQRVAIARALVNDPEIVLADEPTGALDSETSVQVMELLKEVAKDRLVVMVTHNPELADEYATRIVRIKDGKVTDDTDPFVIAGAAPSEGERSPETGAEEENAAVPPAIEVTRGGAKKGKYKKKKAAMSFLTALSLSFNNLRTKKARTILVAIAGSIGIIGIALIQALSNGVNDYIADIEENTVSQYPISINSTGVNMAAYMEMFSEINQKNSTESDEIHVNQVLHKYTSGLTNNDLKSLKAYLDSEGKLQQYAKAVEYEYEVTPRIYRKNNGEIRRVHPDQSSDILGMPFQQISAMNLAAFYTLPKDRELYEGQYELQAGRWPKDSSECVVVLGSDGSITDICAYVLGLKDIEEMDELVRKLMANEDIAIEEDPGTFTCEEIMGTGFKVVNACDYYAYDPDTEFWVDKSSNRKWVDRLFKEGRDLNVCGVVKEKEGENGLLTSGIYVPSDLITELITEAQASDVVQAQLENPSVNIINDKKFGDTSEMEEISLADMLDINEDAIKEAFSFDADELDADLFNFDELEFDPSAFEGLNLEDMDLGDLNLEELLDPEKLGFELPLDKLRQVLQSISFDVTGDDMRDLFAGIMADFISGPGAEEIHRIYAVQDALNTYMRSDTAQQALRAFVEEVLADAAEKAGDDIENIWQYVDITDEQLDRLAQDLSKGFEAYFDGLTMPDLEALSLSFSEYMGSDELRQNLIDFVTLHLDVNEAVDIFYDIMGEVSADVGGKVQEVLTTVISAVMEKISEALAEQISSAMESMMDNVSMKLEDVFTIDEEAIADAFSFNMSEESIRDLFTTMANTGVTTYEKNLIAMGYQDPEDPSEISIYSKDFNSKADILALLDGYNEKMQSEGKEDKVITYSDIAGTMMSSVSSIIGVISTALIALVAISLIVSSIMIGVITYISVLERKKEIGILRALGASKRNVADVFNAETFITGLMAGILGIVVSAVLTLPINWVIADVAGHPEVRTYLDIRTAVLLVALSVALNVLSGFLPSRKASKSNPVTALRDE